MVIQMDYPLWAIIFAFVLGLPTLIYLYFIRNVNYWKNRNIPYIKPTPLIGNLGPLLKRELGMGHLLRDLYNRIDNDVFGFFAFDQPFLIVKSPKLVKQILQKDFSIFDDRTVVTPKNDVLVQHMMFLSKNPTWKSVRSKSTPIFSTGKLKAMFQLVKKEAEAMNNYISNYANVPNVEAKEICAKFSTNVIAICAYSFKAGSFESEDAEFRNIGRQLFDSRLSTSLRQTGAWFWPGLVQMFNIRILETHIIDRLQSIFTEALQAKENSGFTQGNSLLDILLESKKKGGDLSEVAMVATAMQFFTAGFETVSGILSFAIYELTIHQEIQKKLRDEIVENLEQHGEFTYEGIAEMPYLDLVVSETLRKYPTLPFLDRLCKKDYKINEKMTIEKGTKIFIPIFGLHYDPKYFPDPEKFIPERFQDKSAINVDSLYYIPFGEGPRNCIGGKFGLMAVKLGLVMMLSKYYLEKSDKTPEPIIYSPGSLILTSTVGIPIKFVPIVENNIK